jgi:hypothetical protein
MFNQDIHQGEDTIFMPTYPINSLDPLNSNPFFQSDFIPDSPPSDPEATLTWSTHPANLNVTTDFSLYNGFNVPNDQTIITTTIPYSYPYYYLSGMGQITPFYPTVSYTIYKVKYLLDPAGAANLTKELVFTCKTDTAPEVAILQAADLQKLSYILILGIQELSTSEIIQDPNHPIQEIVL